MDFASPIKKILREQGLLSSFLTILPGSDDADSIFDKFYYSDPALSATMDDVYIGIRLIYDGELAIGLPGIDDFKLILLSAAEGITSLDLAVEISEKGFSAIAGNLQIRLRFPNQLLKPVDENLTIQENQFSEISLTGSIGLDESKNLIISGFDKIKLPPAALGNSGVIISAENIKFDFARTNSIPEIISLGLDETFIGIYLGSVTAQYKKNNDRINYKFNVSKAAIGAGGFTGEISLGDLHFAVDNPSIPEALDALFLSGQENQGEEIESTTLFPINLGGMKMVLQYFGVSFKQTIPTNSRILGFVFMPFINNWVRLKASIGGPNADFMLEIGGVGNEGLIELDTPIYKITADSIAYELKNGISYAVVSGKIKLKVPEALNIPELKVNKISIDSDGSVAIEGGWVRAPEQINLNFFGFNIGIREFGLGEEGTKGSDRRQWLGFSGEVELIQGIPIKGSVDGLKISWDKQSGGDIRVALRGIAVELTIPNTLYFKGEVNYDETTNLFKGQIRLKLISLRMEVDAQLMIGKTRDAQGREFGVFYIYLSATLPVALPLGATGTGLYGIKGLVGVNVSPTKTHKQKWYEWYKADPAYDIVTTRKWQAQYDNFAFGAGIQLGTIYDNGTTFNLGAMLVVLIPGPVIMLEGKANLLKVRNPKTTDEQREEGALYLLAVLDCRAGTFEFLLDVRYSLADIVSISGSLEVFFDFNNDQNWYIYLGRKDPESKRLQATVLSFLSANAYFMIGPKAIMLGSAAGLDIRSTWGPVSFALVAKVGFDIAIFFRPFQLEGQIFLVAEITLTVFGFGFRLLLEVMLAGKVPNPFSIEGKARVHLGLPWPLPSIGFEAQLKWEGKNDPSPEYPLLKSVGFRHHKASNYAETITTEQKGEKIELTLDNPVPVDSILVLTFQKRINNLKAIGSEAPLLLAYPYDDVAGTRFRYELQEIQLREVSGDKVIYKGINTAPADTIPSFTIAAGNGQADQEGTSSNFVNGSDAQEPSIMLWKYGYTPFASSYQLDTLHTQHPPCVDRVVLEPELVDWADERLGKQYDVIFSYEDLIFQQIGGTNRAGIVGRPPTNWVDLPNLTPSGFYVGLPGLYVTIPYCLHINGYAQGVRIVFPEPVINVKMRFIHHKNDEIDFSATGFRGDEQVEVLSVKLTSPWSIDINSSANQSIDSIVFTIPNNYKLPDLWLVDITYYKKRHELTMPTNNPGNNRPPASTNATQPFLKPDTHYELRLVTAAYKNDNIAYSSNYIVKFSTDKGPGIQQNLPYKDTPAALVKTYIKDTFPSHGALAHYCDYDIHLTFNEPYFLNLYSKEAEPRLRILDRNGNVVIGGNSEKNMTVMMYRMNDSLDLSSYLYGVEKSAKSSKVCQSNPTNTQFLPTSVVSPEAALQPSTLYFAELVTGAESTLIKLFDFQFTTSKYRNFTDLMKSGATSVSENPGQLNYIPTEVTPISFPANLQDQITQVQVSRQSLVKSEWNSLNQPVTKVIRNQGPQIRTTPDELIENDPVGHQGAVEAVTMVIKNTSHLQATKALGDFKRIRQDLASTCRKSFEEINTAVEKAFLFKVVNERGEESTVDMKVRPLPDKLEFISIPIKDSQSDIILLMESPEPIDFDRININKNAPNQQTVSFISNQNKTKAFVLINGSLKISNSSEFVMVFSGQSDGENVLSAVSGKIISEEVFVRLNK